MTADRADRLRQLTTQMKVPQALTTAGLRERFGDPDNIDAEVGQVRRAEWSGVSRLVLLIADEDRFWRVVPVSIEPTGEDENSLAVGASRTGFPVEVTAWAGLVRVIPAGALSQLIDQWEPDLVGWCAASTDGRPDVPLGARVGEPINRYDPSSTIRADISDELDVLADAPLVPVRAEATVDLKAETQRIGLPVVMSALGLPQGAVMKIVQGKRTVSDEQAARLADLFGRAVEDVLASTSGLPVDLAIELERPRWRARWRSMARRLQITEAAARLMAGTGAVAPAYRQTGAAAPNWGVRVGYWLTANGYDIDGTLDDR